MPADVEKRMLPGRLVTRVRTVTQRTVLCSRESNAKAASQKRPIVPEDLCRFHCLGDPQISPDGCQIVFVDKRVGGRNNYASNLWIVATAKRKPSRRRVASSRLAASILNGKPHGPRALTQGETDREPRWSPDGLRVAFVRSLSPEKSDLYVIDADGGEARRATDFPNGAIGAFLWSPDGKSLAVGFRASRPEWSEDARQQRDVAGLSDPPQIVDNLWYRLDGRDNAAADRCRLYLVDAASGRLREIYGEDAAGGFTFDFSPDGRQLIVSTNRAKEPFLEPWKDELLRISVSTGRRTAMRDLPKGPKTAVRWSPDGKTIAYAGAIGNLPHHSAENLELFVCDVAGGPPRSLTAGFDVCLQAQGVTDMAAEQSAPELQFSRDGRHIYFRLRVRGESHVAVVPVRGGKLKYLTRGAIDVGMGNFSADGRKMAITVGGPTRLTEVAVLGCSGREAGATMLTDMNGPLLAELQLHEPQAHWIKAADGHRVQLWSVIRVDSRRRSAARKLPAVLEIHGGPHAQYGAVFFHEIQVLAAAGYAVFYSNPRGSKGYGRDHCAAINGRWGTDDWTDLQAVIAFMKDHPAVDPRRMGVMGGSYGGYMTNWAIAHCQDFAAAITDRSLSNLVSFSGSTDIVEPPEYFFPGNFWDEADARWEQSPLKHAGKVRTPILIIHSEGDLRCNIEQAEQLYSALKLLGVPVRFIRYPRNTSHGMSRSGPPDMRIHRLREIVAWWQKHLKRLAQNVQERRKGD
jgi:dipeptidyl aminopeptidase/acylaminoacyl peptidase